jgi:UDP-N-acetylglucosamine--N-acetylmuramyl-(pentapeptide) pyrophosphoryl-undecaprenol N-acetylglucosamine transferase
MKIVIAAGGTGGHIYPGIAIAEELKARDPKGEITFIGSREGLEKDLIPHEGFQIELIHARALLRKISYKAISAPFVTLRGFIEAVSVLRRIKPDMVIVTGGYVSFPVLAAAKLLGIKTLLSEQNVLPGMTNRFWSRFVDILTVSFPETNKYLTGTVTGNPVRKRILDLKRHKEPRPTVVILGGSQGARSINNAILDQLPKLHQIGIIHIIGQRDHEQILSRVDRTRFPFYEPQAYLYNIEAALSRADLIVSRAGATAIAEILALGIPSILIPFPYSAEGHQDLNAQVVAKAGAGIALKDQGLAGLGDLILKLLDNPEHLRQMGQAARKMARPEAASKIADLIYAIS